MSEIPGRPFDSLVMKGHEHTGRPLVAVVARVTETHTRTGRLLVAVVTRVTERHTRTGRPLVAVVARVTETYTYRQTVGCCGCESN